MKKISCIFIAVIFAALPVYAAEPAGNDPPKTPAASTVNISAGFTFASNPKLYGGHFELGIVLFRKAFYLTNRFMLRAGGVTFDGMDTTLLTLSEKLVLGRSDGFGEGTYVYLEGGAGTYGNASSAFFKNWAFSFGFGGGFEIGDIGFGAIYIEVGYLGQQIGSSFPKSGVVVQTGWRIFL
ncbi:MAG: hypothetical protein LBI14_03965 [Treponema sp.]|jgi:hypothetical protein|nr:hypothetical protein [Treponema sp.]